MCVIRGLHGADCFAPFRDWCEITFIFFLSLHLSLQNSYELMDFDGNNIWRLCSSTHDGLENMKTFPWQRLVFEERNHSGFRQFSKFHVKSAVNVKVFLHRSGFSVENGSWRHYPTEARIFILLLFFSPDEDDLHHPVLI